MPWYCSTGWQPGPEGWTQETSSCVLQVSYRRGCTGQTGNSHIIVPALSLGGLRSWEAIWANGLLGLVEEPV